ncbi:Protein CBG13083 [Caenorhabditis briggsae]|uniref:Protein CBG13083 n=1 Tax=Caenorhabditis briggsae TaxID=6238 RepID=A8XH17_CAEBR|nr:Protein CBG13083 [Caenorhabditis briggsae]CAP31941.2 Protein CBG13083 [Caenorhabditis briggsae]
MSESSELPTIVSKPPKTRTKLPIYLVSAIVVALVVIVVVINIVHRLPDSPDDSKDSAISKTTHSSGIDSSSIVPATSPYSSSTESPLITSTDYSTSTSESDSSSSNSDEDHKDGENSTLVQVTVTTTVIPTSTIQETTVETTTDYVSSTSTQSSSSMALSSSSSPISETTVIPDTTFIPPTGVECGKTCSVSVVESIPRGVWFVDRVYTKNSYESWMELLGSAKSEIDIFAYKMNLRGKELRYDVDNSTFEGRQIYSMIEDQAKSGILIKLIDCQPPTFPENDYDADELERLGLVQRQGLDMNTMNGGGGGVQHSKTFIVDDRHLFVGSLNFEWKSFSQKLEIGLEFHDCPCIAKDASSLFDQMFDSLSGNEKLETLDFQPHKIGNSTFQFLVSIASPSFLLSSSHSWDLEALLNLIYEADESVDISVMQYFPSWIYFKNREFYFQIDNAIRMSISRGIKFRILVSGDQKEEQKLMFAYLRSLSVLHSPSENRFIQIKFVLIPQTAQESYKDRKMHAKFILSEKRTIIGSSNYAPEYFYKSTGTAVVVDEEPFHGDINRQVKAVFERYWHSTYTQNLQKFGESKGFLPKTTKPSNPFAGWFGFDQIGVFNEKYSVSGLFHENDSEKDQLLDPIIFI